MKQKLEKTILILLQSIVVIMVFILIDFFNCEIITKGTNIIYTFLFVFFLCTIVIFLTYKLTKLEDNETDN